MAGCSAGPEAGASGAHPQDPVLAAFGGLGAGVDCSGLRALSLEGPSVLWLVAHGSLDLFAVDAAGAGAWHFLGRVGAGALLLGPAEGPRHTLVGRPSAECLLRRVDLRELYRPEPGRYEGGAPGWYESGTPGWYGAVTNGSYGSGAPVASPLEDAFALGVGRGLRVLYEAPLDDRTGGPDVVTDDEVVWMRVPPGSLAYGAVYEAAAAGTLLVDAALWQGMVEQQYRLLHALDGWIEERERAQEDRTAAGLAAGRAAGSEADRTLLAALGRHGGRSRGGGDADATLAVCRLVAADARIALPETVGGAAAAAGDERLDPVERIALAARVRTREIGLRGRWWRENAGPLVGRREQDGAPVALLWRRGRYVAVDRPGGRRERIGADEAAGFEDRAVMFYRPLPEGRLGLVRLLRFCARGTRLELRDLLLGGLVSVVLGATVPLATGRVLGAYVPAGESGLIVRTALALVAAAVVSAAFMLLQNVALLRMEGRIEATLQPAVWDRLLRLPTTFFTGRSTGELANAALGIGVIRRMLSGVAPVCLQAGAVGGVNLVLLLAHSVPLGLVALAMLLVVAAVLLGLGLWQLRYQRRLVELGNRLDNQAFQTLRGLPKLRVAAAESFAYAAWAREFARTRVLQQRAGRIQNAVTVIGAVCLPLCTLVMFVLLAGPARGTMSAAGFLTFSTALTMLLASVTQLTGALLSVAAVLPVFEQVEPILREAPEVRGGAARPGVLSGAIEARQLSYRYGEDGPLVLDGVDLTVGAGEFVAVVGASGCGKSTLLRLLIGFDRPTEGAVRYDGQDLAALDQAAVRRQCGVVLQHAQPLTGSILDCVRGAEAYTLEEVWEAVALAGLADDVRAMPMGLHTMLSDGGGTISGGQRQRLMIARALIRKPRILFLDEATSALDNEAQRVVIESTRALRTTRVVIAHRLSTVMGADRVVAMADGRVVQQGTPAELLAEPDGLFHELVRRQLR
ncbi:NHLP bacteriocin export ABC transporter permease/ATPase subunit [Streptomyces roseicoloratus]|uniref:NHLP bacteriocin export ABC transporter permease/ATPase subunit n=1 Tax=Streptomyces roseicoloratus TaxID=2508722 RepID=A0ABY9S370_9ACTN|nr:NHLP bacteriocin export ABC transporter permease/ATPase subunit [Streptomyces roseicoloratus]WMX48707.1 NHLP bacteriocin export ABC transporter permease/ATPase subunit [Streptomyces roseicoloratus]